MIWPRFISVKAGQTVIAITVAWLGTMAWVSPVNAQLFGSNSNSRQPNFAFRNMPGQNDPAARITPAGIYQGFDPRVTGSFLVPRDVNSYGYAYYFGQGDPAINSAAAYWLLNETRGQGARTGPNTAQTQPKSRQQSRAALTTKAANSSSRNGDSQATTRRSSSYPNGNQPGGTAADRFSAYPTAAGSRVSDRFNRYDRRFNQLTPRR